MELVYTHVLEACAKACRFKSCHLYQVYAGMVYWLGLCLPSRRCESDSRYPLHFCPYSLMDRMIRYERIDLGSIPNRGFKYFGEVSEWSIVVVC